ncbi:MULTISPECIES: DUF4148 domain-containing protein [Burkholderia cepacia complex]|uniref:DUF4148 domain-containing protein n=1 Tax=Burkholderia cepacia complex TaxID=87882 RepID=UPI00067945B9|nr:DUF4148 domain-containing protein [Burkholderia cenocepacia]KWU23871.1 hypothetical protein AS149_34945 [Burkholderia cenocepacia]CAG2316480.1 purine nucleoside phosphorylase [Burkholderia cenocepacia]CAG2316504.1 purine nucleoside phosphorylase [Burkholderia cenocepacia]CAG2316578.1 purine nucleoside phosphorylase [Burkholderia cenocepacia]CAG2316608.1 purine nucleoside phosphorylase [Burkholderia cenocepacia]
MKSIIVTIAAVAATALLAAPTVSYAQASHSTLTRAQVRQELLDLESVGYNPSTGDGDNYPDDIVAAQERLAAKRLAEHKRSEAAYGSTGAPGTFSGAPAVAAVKR